MTDEQNTTPPETPGNPGNPENPEGSQPSETAANQESTEQPATSGTEPQSGPGTPLRATPEPGAGATSYAATVGAATAPASAPRPTPETAAGGWWWGTGRRKSSVARVRVRPGNGEFTVNNRPFDQYFTELRDHRDLMNVLEKTGTKGSVDVRVKVSGGGFTGQAGAIILGLGRALKNYDQSLEPILRDNHFLTRDPRQVERKKYGQPGARKQFQFSKR